MNLDEISKEYSQDIFPKVYLKEKYGRSKRVKGHPLIRSIDTLVTLQKSSGEHTNSTSSSFFELLKARNLDTITGFIRKAFEAGDFDSVIGAGEILKIANEYDGSKGNPETSFRYNVLKAWEILSSEEPADGEGEESYWDHPTVEEIFNLLWDEGKVEELRNNTNESSHKLIRRYLLELGLRCKDGERSKYKK